MNIIRRNNVQVVGEGEQYMVFAHGFGCDQHAWRWVVPAFSRHYKLVLFDFVGAGKSDLSAYDRGRYNSLDGYASDVLDICEALNLDNAIYIGHSVSSMIGLLAALRQPDRFGKMVFIGPSARYINDPGYAGGMEREDLEALLEVMDSNYLGWSQSLAPAIMGNAERPELGKALANSFCATDPTIARQFARVTFLSDNRKDLGKMKVKSLSLQTDHDILAPDEASKFIQQHTPGNTVMKIAASGHCPHLSAPEVVVDAIKAYVN